MKRGFYWLSKSWYGAATLANADYIDEIMIGKYEQDHGCEAEMSFRWYMLSGKNVAKLESFEDSWKMLAEFSDLISELAKLDNKCPTPQQIVDLLIRLGFKNLTNTKNPHRETDEKIKKALGKLDPEEKQLLGLKNFRKDLT